MSEWDFPQGNPNESEMKHNIDEKCSNKQV